MGRRAALTFAAMIFFGAISYAWAEEIGMVMDVSGDAKILRKGVSAPADLGKSISFDDVFKLGAGAKLAVVTYIDCNQWMMAGPGEFKVNSSQAIEAANGKLAPAKKMPVCYEPDSITAESTNTIGAFVLRGGAKDPVADLRAEFENGNASLSTLMTLVMYDLQNGRKDSARPYFEELSKRAPESQFVKRISGIFRD